ncbi:MAG: nitroreductase family deazaflavin-dependent oxidoreductase [Armatimonadetes bacterium]|nr:MAG: nitroreductase family deazaflavin-dependent oxidoreductase [Armatimonadota bacterium]
MSDWNAGIIEEFRANNGAVGGMFEGAPLLILGTTGAKSHQRRENPLMYRDEGDRRFIFASKGGAPNHPHWLLNVRANPTVVVEVPGETYEATAVEVEEPERSEIYERQGSAMPQFAEYQQNTERIIPVVELIKA